MLLNFIPFKSFLKHILTNNKNLKYKDIYELINDVFFDQKNLAIVLENANKAIFLTNTQLFRSF
jgi:multisubunit Na+/H+ antiporter MnhB subunit